MVLRNTLVALVKVVLHIMVCLMLVYVVTIMRISEECLCCDITQKSCVLETTGRIDLLGWRRNYHISQAVSEKSIFA